MARSQGQNYNGEILHFHAVRLRLIGSGTFDLEMMSLDDVNTSILPSITMSSATNREPTVLANYRDQRGRLRGSVNVINETFNISKIVIFIRPLATGYPQ